jgi:hypothetical protein
MDLLNIECLLDSQTKDCSMSRVSLREEMRLSRYQVIG